VSTPADYLSSTPTSTAAPGPAAADVAVPRYFETNDQQPGSLPALDHNVPGAPDLEADIIGPTMFAIPIRNELASARVAHALTNVREAQLLVDETVRVLATVRGFHFESYRLGHALGSLTDALRLIDFRQGMAQTSDELFDLKQDPTQAEVNYWISSGVPLPT
jgi:hypothetical protein